jgi:K+-transporting ATPase KdpF subunit
MLTIIYTCAAVVTAALAIYLIVCLLTPEIL